MNWSKGSLILIRPDLTIAAGICVITGQMLALGALGTPFQIFAGFFSVALISGAILAINDYFDVASDIINAPTRPIPSGMISKNGALLLSLVLLAVGLSLAIFISILSFLACTILAVVGFLYNWRLKRTGLPGNLMVSFSVGMTFVYGGITVGLPLEKTVFFFGLLAAMLDLGEEIAADAMDMEGDKKMNSNSLAIKYGKAFVLRISCMIFGFVLILTIIPFLLGWFEPHYFIPFIFMDGVLIYSMIKLLNSKGDEGRNHIKWIYRSSTAAILAFLVLRLI
ncbi:geranylgeranylglycerol-phosphate geranylgeranyltransferase [Ignavibacteriales bacterium]